jgi:hypothetical protein
MSVVGWILLQKSKVASVRIFGSGVRWRHPGSVRPGYHPSPMLKLYIGSSRKKVGERLGNMSK